MKKYFLFILLCSFIIISCKENGNTPSKGSILGVVLNAKDNSPIANAFISTEPATETMLTGTTGKFTISNITSGDFIVKASKTGFKSNSVIVNVSEGRTSKATILLDPEGGIDTTTGLIAYWSFDDGTANDNSGNGYNGIIKNYPTFVNGRKGKAMHFQGRGYYSTYPEISEGDFVKLPMIPFAQMPEFSISMWVKEEDFSSWYGEFFISFGSAESGLLGIGDLSLQRFENDQELYSQFWVGGDGAQSSLYYSSSLYNKNAWVHYVLTSKNNIMKGYINGQLIGSKFQSVLVNGNYGALASHFWSYYGEQRTSARFTGSIDEVKIFGKALSDSEIQTIFNE